jgi:hypothetical protein
LVREAREAASVQVERQGVVVGAEDVNAHVEFLASDQQRVVDVALHNVRLCLLLGLAYARVVRFPAEVAFPVADLTDFVEYEDAFALALADGLHDPEGVRVLVVLVFEDGVVVGEVVGDWEEVESIFCL